MRILDRFRGLTTKIYVAFLITTVVPVMAAGIVGIYYSLNALRSETLKNLDSEVSSRAGAIGRFFDQLNSELLYLASSATLRELVNDDPRRGSARSAPLRRALEREYESFARAYPHIYQVRLLDERGMEVVRVDRKGDRIHVVPWEQLQDKSQRYYFHDAIEAEAGQVYVSPLDLNVEHGVVESPERPVIRFATPLVDRAGAKKGLLVINLHAAFVLGQIEELAAARDGVAYLFDRAGFYLARQGGNPAPGPGQPAEATDSFRMESMESLTELFPRRLLAEMLSGKHDTMVLGDSIIAYAPIVIGRDLVERASDAIGWAVGLSFPRKRLLEAVFNLYVLYAVLALCLVAAAVAGALLSRNLLRPLRQLADETEEIAAGNFAHRVRIRGRDEIAGLGERFNQMAERLAKLYRALDARRGELESEVGVRTAELERERRNLAAIIASSVDGILAVAPNGTIRLANAAAARHLAGVDCELVGRQIDEYWPRWRERGGNGESSVDHDLAIGARKLSLNIATLSSGEESAGHIIVTRDVTAERALQQARRELDRQVFQMEKMTTMGELAMGLAHEIGNPLAGMKAVVQMMLEERNLPARHEEYLRRVESEVDRLSGFVRTFRGMGGHLEPRPVPSRIGDLLDDVLLWTRAEARAQGVKIRYAPCASHVPRILADPGQFKQVMLNLVINAIRAMPGGGTLDIEVCATTPPPGAAEGDAQAWLAVTVRDTGVGMTADVRERIFEPFFSTRDGGSGLGLAVVRKICADHGAWIHVESEPDAGSEFELRWPAAAPAADHEKAGPSHG